MGLPGAVTQIWSSTAMEEHSPSAFPSPPQSHHDTAQLGGETFPVPLQPDPNLLGLQALTSLAQCKTNQLPTHRAPK